jgi:acetyl esterase
MTQIAPLLSEGVSSPYLAHRSDFSTPHPDALRVIEALTHSRPPRDADMAAIRRHHRESRRPFLAALEPVERIFHIAGAGLPQLTVIRPLGFRPDDAAAAILYLHGGGWTVGSLETYEPFLRALSNATQAVVIWLEYSLAPEHPFPAAYDEASAALYWMRDNAARLGIDPNRISIGGDSAGANIAAVLALAERKAQRQQPLAQQLLFYPCLDLTASQPSHETFAEGYLLTAPLYGWYRRNYLGGLANPAHWRLSPLFADDLSGLPPTTILYAGFDPLRDEAAAYALKLTVAQVDVETLYFPDMIHGFLTMGGAISAAGTAVRRIGETFRAFEKG